MGWYYDYPPPSPRPEALPGMGRKQYGEKWWSKQWLSALDSFGWETRLARGRSYARAGRVRNYKISNGMIKADVEGTSLYSVKIKLGVFKENDWEKAIKNMSEKAIFAAKLLTGEMPAGIEEVFKASRLSLIPSKPKDIKASCSCPDYANPCKHIAAVFYIIADDLDNDPFLLFELRGMGKEILLEKLREKRMGSQEKEENYITEKGNVPETDERDFWEAGRSINSMIFSVDKPETSCILLKKIGKPTFWISKIGFEKELCIFYEKISRKAADMAMGMK